MAVTVRVPMALRKLTGGSGEVQGEGADIRSLIDDLESNYGGLKSALCDESGKVRGYVNIYVNDEDFRNIDGVDTSLKDGDDVAIIPAIAGGF